MIGKQILNYKVISLIGEGGMGNVYLGEHLSIGRKVAIKELRPELASNQEIRSRFKNEASVMAHLQHPGIVALFDYVENEDGLYLIMEYIEGQELTELLKNLTAPLSIQRAKNIMSKVLVAFEYAHKNGIVHRDVKPSNILITAEDEVKVLDFGIAKLVGDSQFNLTKTGTQVGTVYYMSPEQVKAQDLDHRSDIYSLGVTFYELLSGFCPYKSMTSEYEVYDKIVREDLLPLTDTMGDEYKQVWSVIEKATSKEKEDRFQSCLEMNLGIDENAVVQIKKQKTIVKKKPVTNSTIEQTKSKKSNRWIYFVLGGVILVLGVFLVTSILSKNKEDLKDEIEMPYALEEPEVIEEEIIEEVQEPENWMSDYNVNSIMESYYYDKNNDSFDANSYYASMIDLFITKKNQTPYDVNRMISENTEYLNGMTSIIDGSTRFERVEGGVSFWSFWVDFQCFRRSKSKIQRCKINIEVGFNQETEIKSYKELKVSELEFVDNYDY